MEPFAPGLYAILDASVAPLDVIPDLALVLAEAGASALQIRGKDCDARALLDGVERVRDALASTHRPPPIFVNDRVDVARLAGCSVHVGQRDITPRGARLILGPSALIGLSTHSAAQVHAAAMHPVDYIGFGPVFGTSTKPDASPRTGVEALGMAVRTSRRAVVAIGGIGRSQVADVRCSGAHAFAVISALFDDDGRGGSLDAIVGRNARALLATWHGTEAAGKLG